MHRPTLPGLLLFAVACRLPSIEPSSAPTPAGSASTSPSAPAFPEPNTRAPDFTLVAADGTSTALADLVSRGPVVIVFGSFT